MVWDFAEEVARRNRQEARVTEVELFLGEADPVAWQVDESGALKCRSEICNSEERPP